MKKARLSALAILSIENGVANEMGFAGPSPGWWTGQPPRAADFWGWQKNFKERQILTYVNNKFII
jgi:hypothetical protein